MLLGLLSSASAQQKVTIDGIDVYRLSDGNIEVSIVPSMGNIAYEMKVNGKNVFWFPFDSVGAWKAKPTQVGNPFLAPWANRLDQDAFYANGKKYALDPGLGNFRRDQNKNPIHGLLVFSPLWRVIDPQPRQLTSLLEFWKYPDLMAQFPFAHTYNMTYRLSNGTLEVETSITNHSTEPMPLAIGYHPYFQIHDAPRDQWKVHVAAYERMVLSPLLIPTGERKPTGLPQVVSLANTQLDDVFTGLERDSSGRAEFWVQGAREKISVSYGPKYPVAVVYAPPGRSFICFEPMTAITNAFNLAQQGIYKDLPSIPPGATWTESFWIKPTGF